MEVGWWRLVPLGNGWRDSNREKTMNEQMFHDDLCADDPLQAREDRSPAPGGATMNLRALARQGDHLRQFSGNFA